jgi:hypothetical protein
MAAEKEAVRASRYIALGNSKKHLQERTVSFIPRGSKEEKDEPDENPSFSLLLHHARLQEQQLQVVHQVLHVLPP